MRRLLILWSSAVLLLLFTHNGLSQELTELEKAEFQKNIIVPSPADLFLAVDKIGALDWQDIDVSQNADMIEVFDGIVVKVAGGDLWEPFLPKKNEASG